MKKYVIFIMLILFCSVVAASDFLLKQIIMEGEEQEISVGGWDYTIKLVVVSDSTGKAILEVNGERTDTMKDDDSHKLSDGTVIQVREVLPNEGGADLVQYNIFTAGKKVGTKVSAEPVSVESVSEAKPVVQPTVEPVAYSQSDSPSAPGRQEAVVDMSRKVEKKGWLGRFVDWLKGLF
ncbi:hypothetical protein ACFL0V_03575 [Nanoarchaeota archaeon]